MGGITFRPWAVVAGRLRAALAGSEDRPPWPCFPTAGLTKVAVIRRGSRLRHPAAEGGFHGLLAAVLVAGACLAAPTPEPPWSEELVHDIVADARTHGDPRRGAVVFGLATSACTSCHRVGDRGGQVGPELTTVATCRTAEEIVEALWWPDRTVRPEHRALAVVDAAGRAFQGVVREDSPERLVLVDATGAVHTLAVAEIDERRDIGSLMPKGLLAGMSPTQRRDLVRYLIELGRTPGLEQVAHGPVAFTPPHGPLRPEAWPHARHAVNRERVYDWYTRQALHFRSHDPPPVIVPEWPGIDGGRHGHWGNQNDQDTWRDGRWNDTDLGSLQCWAFKVPAGAGGGNAGRTLPRAVCLRLGADGDLNACFNPDTLEIEAVWTGGFLRFAEQRHGFLAPAEPAGALVERPSHPDLPRGTIDYHGFYRHGPRVIFSYAIDGVEMLDSPWAEDGRFERVIAPAAEHPLAHLTRGGPPRWPQTFVVQGTLGTERPYAIDTIPLPFDNPWRALLFCGGHDFFSDGSAAVCTMQGDVWRVDGLDESLREVRWRRMATGLNRALGLVVVDDEVHVQCGDQITKLVDLDGDGEADFYEAVSRAVPPSTGHDYNCGLERDSAGTFYTASHRSLLRVTPDGTRADVLATGLRNPDGLGLLPDGTLTVPVSEGDWTPASAICLVRSGTEPVPNFQGRQPAWPLVYLPRGLDNSSGGQVSVSSDRWGPLGGQLVHLSFGTCTHFLVLRDEILGDANGGRVVGAGVGSGRSQGAIVPLPGEFRSGVHRGRFAPHDGQLYVTGMNGWGSYAIEDGCFQRVRWTGDPVMLPSGFRMHRDGVVLRFTGPLDPAVASRPECHFAQCWNYRYGPGYGSREYSPSHYGTPGHDPLRIAAAEVLPDGKSLFLALPDIQPVSQLHLLVTVAADETREVFATVHALAAPFRDSAAAARIIHAHPLERDLALLDRIVPNPWTKRIAGARAVELAAGPNLSYTRRELRARPGEALSLSFRNPDAVPHNWVLVKPGALARVGDLANRLIADPDAVARHYVPQSDDVLTWTSVAAPGATQTIHFTAPAAPGRYPYLCTFPGHWMVMNGELVVEAPVE
jgi:putative heme-binding domain-containing protein